MVWGRRGSAVGARTFAKVLAVLVVAGCQHGVSNAQVSFSSEYCRRSPVERGRENPLEQHVNAIPDRVFEACARIADNPRSRADQQVNAQYYTARALATLHEQRQQADLPRAAALLDLVVRTPWPEADPARQRARVQLARVHRLLIAAEQERGALIDRRRFVEALALLDQALTSAQMEAGAANAVVLDARYERARILLQRDEAGDSEAALRDLSVFAANVQPSSAWSMNGQRGRAELIALAQKLGDEAMAAAPTQSNIDRALDYYVRAQAAVETGGAPPAGVDPPDIYISLGDATLRRAALARGLSMDRRCEHVAGDADAARLLVQARSHFERARSFPGHSPLAEHGSGCASLGLGQLDQALRSFEAANQAGATDIDSLLELARAYANVAAILDAQHAPRFWTAAEETYQRALGMVGADIRRRARINVELAQARQARGDLAGAMQVLTAALADQPTSPDALLARGRLICGADASCKELNGITTLSQARADLSAVVDQIPPPDATVRAEAHHHLSLLADRPSSAGGNGASAVRHADAAFSLALTGEYREHACLMRIRYYNLRGVGERDERRRDEGTRYCLAGENRAPAALLLEGEYHMSRARSLPGGARDRAREEAYRTFGEALRLIGRTETADARDLRDRLELGQAFIQYCLGLEGVGSEAITRIDPNRTIRQHFIDHDVWDCSPR